MQTSKVSWTPAACRLLLPSLLLLGCAPLRAQAGQTTSTRTWGVDSMLARFEHDVHTNAVQEVGVAQIMRLLRDPGASGARRDSLLNGMERLALTGRTRDIRHAGALYLAVAGTFDMPTPARGVVARLVRTYRVQDDPAVRLTIRNQLPLQVERPAAAAFLRAIAAEPDSSSGRGPHGYFSHGDPRTEALARLAEMGEVGRAVLQAMHRSGEARSPQARITLDNMAQRGFPVREIARARP